MAACALFLLSTTACLDPRPHPDKDTQGNQLDSDQPWEPGDLKPLDERCNGIDDDGDGLVDEGFEDVDADGVADCVDDACALEPPEPRAESCGVCQGEARPADPPPVNPWDWVVEWSWSGEDPQQADGGVEVTPVVGDLDGDGQPEVVVIYFPSPIEPSVLVVLDGATGSPLWRQGGYWAEGPAALGDIDGDGFGDIVAYAWTGEGSVFLKALDRNGDVLWELEHDSFRFTGDERNPHIVDLEGDGVVEVLAEDLIIDGATGTVIAALEGATPWFTSKWVPTTADLEGDGFEEILIRNGVYDHHGAHLFDCGDGTTEDSYIQALDLDGDAFGEVIHSGYDTLTACDDDGSVLWTMHGDPRTGPAAVADFDNDGLQEFALVVGSELLLMEQHGVVRWRALVTEPNGGGGPVAWDMDLDGVPELIIADVADVLVLDGATGAVRLTIHEHSSVTMYETPAIADIDGDGHGEILIASNNCVYPPCSWTGLHALGSADNDWPWAPPVYNQHAYQRGDIEDDLSVSTDTTAYWLRDENILRGQSTRMTTPELPNLQGTVHEACVASCKPGGYAQLALQIWNSGSADTEGTVVARLYAIISDTQELVAEFTFEDPIPAQGSTEWFFETTQELLGSELMLVVDEDDTIEECIEDDNVGVLTTSVCDEGGGR